MSVIHRLSTAAAVAALATVGVLGLGVGPAAADHVVDVTDDACYAGPISSRTGLFLTTTSARAAVLADGSTRYTCTFTGLPVFTSGDDNGYFDWSRPTRALRLPVSCATTHTISFAGEVTYTPSGMMRVVCTEPAG